MKPKELIKLKEKEDCNWCYKTIGTNAWGCIKCQGFILGQEKMNQIWLDRIDEFGNFLINADFNLEEDFGVVIKKLKALQGTK